MFEMASGSYIHVDTDFKLGRSHSMHEVISEVCHLSAGSHACTLIW